MINKKQQTTKMNPQFKKKIYQELVSLLRSGEVESERLFGYVKDDSAVSTAITGQVSRSFEAESS